MLHLLLNVDPKGIAVAPFTPKFLDYKKIKAKNLGIECSNNCDLLVLPSISSFVGADILCGIIASDMIKDNETNLLIDIGTNGEMALYHNNKIYSCATAAGPAFEGYNISNGTGCIEGAINKVTPDGEITTILNGEPVGICGSGLVDAVSMLIKNEIVDENGYMSEAYELSENVKISPRDIREIQLAKSAICSGVMTLLDVVNLSPNEINNVFLAGGFGSYINSESAMNIGMFPSQFKNKITSIGNSALNGCIKALYDTSAIAEMNEIKANSEYIELSESSKFQDFFIENMFFPNII